MSGDISEVKMGLVLSVNKMMDGGGAVYQALEEYKAALAALSKAGDGTTQADVDAMRGQLAWIIDQLEQILGVTHSTKNGVDDIYARL